MIKYIILGLVQGLAEFLPVSSSAHLIILQKILGITRDKLALTIFLHLGTICSLLVFFNKDIFKALRNLKTIFMVIAVTLVTVIIAFPLKGFSEKVFTSSKLIACALAITGVILIFTRKFMHEKREELNFKDALMLGLAQGISAICRGISRSGITVSTLLFRKIKPEAAFKFSFIASIPAILGAAVLDFKEIRHALKFNFTDFIVGFGVSFLSGLLALWFLRKALDKAKLHYFGYYCIIVAILTFIFIK